MTFSVASLPWRLPANLRQIAHELRNYSASDSPDWLLALRAPRAQGEVRPTENGSLWGRLADERRRRGRRPLEAAIISPGPSGCPPAVVHRLPDDRHQRGAEPPQLDS